MINLPEALKLIRFRQWWIYKIAPALGIFLLFRAENPEIIGSRDIIHLLLLTVALALSATFTSVSNDLADIESDRIAGKYNRLSGWSHNRALVLLAGIVLAGAAVGLLLPGVRLKICFLILWINWALYSVEPFRAKKRGGFGPLLDSTGSHVIPCILAILLSGFTPESDPIKSSLAALWSFLWGTRGIIWHQLYDFEHDSKSSIRTMPGVVGYERSIFISEKILFPAETGVFIALLAIMQPALLIPFFVCIIMELAGNYSSVVPREIVRPGGMNWLYLTDYYTLILPLSIFFSSPKSFLLPAGIIIVFFLRGYMERIFADYRILYRFWRNWKNRQE